MKKPFAYQDQRLSASKRVKDLLSRMTLDEKAAQMMCVWQKKAETLVDEDGNFDLAKATNAFKHGNGIGQVGGQATPEVHRSNRGKAKTPGDRHLVIPLAYGLVRL